MENFHEMLMTSKFHCFDKNDKLKNKLANVSDTSGHEKLSSDVQAYLLCKGSHWIFQETLHAFCFTLPSLPATHRGLCGGESHQAI